MRVLVTGGAGFIGSTLCRRLIQLGFSVINVDKLTYAANLQSQAEITSSSNYALERVDVTDRKALQHVFDKHQPQTVFHLAAESHVDRSIDDAGSFIQTNFVGTYQLLEVARRYCHVMTAERRGRFRVIHVSTDEVFGSLGPDGHFREDTPYRPSSPYSASKAGSDHLVAAWSTTYGLPTITCNCSNNYGPYQFPEKLIPLTTINALEGKPIQVYGEGKNVRDWIYVEDFVEGLITVLFEGQPGERYNFGGGCERTNLEVVQAICAVLDRIEPSRNSRASLITFVPDRPGHDLRYAVDSTKARRELGWSPKFDFDRGLELTVEWYVNHPEWWRPVREHVYRGQRLGLVAAKA